MGFDSQSGKILKKLVLNNFSGLLSAIERDSEKPPSKVVRIHKHVISYNFN